MNAGQEPWHFALVLVALLSLITFLCSCSTPTPSKHYQADGWTPDREARLGQPDDRRE